MRDMMWPMHIPADRLDDGEVSLRPYRPEDAPVLFEAVRDERAWEHLPGAIPTDFAALDAEIAAKLADGRRLTFTVRRGEAVAGRTSILWDPSDPNSVEIGGTQFDPTAWGTGLNTQVKHLLIAAIFDRGAASIRFRTDERNVRSAAAIRKLGAIELGVRPDTRVRRDGSVRNSRHFRLDRPAS